MASVIHLLLLLGIIYPVLSGPWNVENLPRSMERVSFKECNLDPVKREECGGYGVTEEDCYSRECCWGKSDRSGVPWCYHSIKTNSKVCAASAEAREECGWMGIHKEQCLASDCCWRPSEKGHAWCIKKVRVPVLTGECGKTAIKPNTLGRIIGGEDAVPHSWPWMASLQEDGEHVCGGSLINHEWILSAAHCYPFGGMEGVVAVLGAHNVSSEDNEKTKLTIEVSKAIQHENYYDLNYDIMLLKLAHPVEFNDVISPLCLTNEAPSNGQHCYSMGWGVDTFEDFVMTTPDIMQQFMSPVIDTSRCNGTDMYNGDIQTTAICAGFEEGGRGNCFGDSGGPLVTKENGRWSQVGIVSWGEPCANAMYPTVYTDVSQMEEWIENVVGEN